MKISWEEISKEYSNIKDKEKYSHLKEKSILINIIRKPATYETKYKSAVLNWSIEYKRIQIVSIDKGKDKNIGLPLFLATMVFMEKEFRKKISELDGIEILSIIEENSDFWAKVFGFEKFNTLKEFVKETDGTIDKFGKDYEIYIPFKPFIERIKKVWKK